MKLPWVVVVVVVLVVTGGRSEQEREPEQGRSNRSGRGWAERGRRAGCLGCGWCGRKGHPPTGRYRRYCAVLCSGPGQRQRQCPVPVSMPLGTHYVRKRAIRRVRSSAWRRLVTHASPGVPVPSLAGAPACLGCASNKVGGGRCCHAKERYLGTRIDWRRSTSTPPIVCGRGRRQRRLVGVRIHCETARAISMVFQSLCLSCALPLAV